jgi:hypothetical protein
MSFGRDLNKAAFEKGMAFFFFALLSVPEAKAHRSSQ